MSVFFHPGCFHSYGGFQTRSYYLQSYCHVSDVTPRYTPYQAGPERLSYLMHELTNSPDFLRLCPYGAFNGRVHVDAQGISFDNYSSGTRSLLYSYGSYSPYLDRMVYDICDLTQARREEPKGLELTISGLALSHLQGTSSFSNEKEPEFTFEMPFSMTVS